MTTIQTSATLRSLRMSPRKVRLLIDLIRGMNAHEALVQLQFSAKEAARPVYKLLASGIANATHNHGADAKTLVVSKATVDGGAMMYRYTPRAMGRATPVRHRTSHITLVLTGVGSATHRAEAAHDHENHEGHDHAHEEAPKKVTKARKAPATKKPRAASKASTAKAKKNA